MSALRRAPAHGSARGTRIAFRLSGAIRRRQTREGFKMLLQDDSSFQPDIDGANVLSFHSAVHARAAARRWASFAPVEAPKPAETAARTPARPDRAEPLTNLVVLQELRRLRAGQASVQTRKEERGPSAASE